MTYTAEQRRRFWSKTRRVGACLHWTGTVYRGRGKLTVNSRVRWASRVAYEMHYGAIPDGLQVLHTCDNGLCVEPTHLYAGTPKQNMQDMSRRERRRRKLTMTQARAIRASAALGTHRRVLAERYGVSKTTIDMIVHGRTYLERT